MGDGRKFKLALRKPNPGERVMQINRHHETLTNYMKVFRGGEVEVNMEAVKAWFLQKRPRLEHFYLVRRGGYIHNHFTIVVEAV